MFVLEQDLTLDNYFSKLSTKSESTKSLSKTSIKHFQEFCFIHYSKQEDEIFIKLNSMEPRPRERSIFDMLQEFINYLDKRKVTEVAVKTYFSQVKPYVSYRTDTKIHEEDVKSNLKFRRIPQIRKHILTRDEARTLIDEAENARKAIYLLAISTGISIGEMKQLKKRDFQEVKYTKLDGQTEVRYKISVPASYRKVKIDKVTFASKEAERYFVPILHRKGMDDLLFTSNENTKHAVVAEEQYFNNLRKKTGLTAKYENGRHKITIHIFRSYFISKCEKINAGLGHALAGHGRYMKIYERYSDEELLDFYLKAEPELTIYHDAEEGITLKSQLDQLSKELAMERLQRNQEKEMYEQQIKKLTQEMVLNRISSQSLD